jgi:hypothetical protein
MTTISLPLAIWGNGYGGFLQRWIEGVNALNVRPNEIVIVTDIANKNVLESVDTDIPTKTYSYDLADYRLWDKAIRKCKSKWVAICNVDDQFLPGALDEIAIADEQGCNLVLDALRVKQTGHIWRGHWDESVLPRQFTAVGAEPMTKELYIAAGGYEHTYQFPDWALAVHIVHRKLAKPYTASTHRILFDDGSDRVTLSGQSQNPGIKAAGTAQVIALSQSLGLL